MSDFNRVSEYNRVSIFGVHVHADGILCCSVLQCVAVCCSVLQWVAVGCSGLQWVAVGCSKNIVQMVDCDGILPILMLSLALAYCAFTWAGYD